MFTKFLAKTGSCFILLCTLLTGALAETPVDSDYQDPNRVSEYLEHKELYDILGLREDATDSQIIQLLDIPEKRIIATSLIRHKRISSAAPKLLQIVNDVNDNDALIFAKLTAAEALCDFGNKEWMPTIKTLSTDPNSLISRTPLQLDVAGLLARAGDYSQFEVVANQINSNKYPVRYAAIKALENFRHKTDPVTDSAAGLLTSVATSDPVPWLRERAIESLEKIASTKPAVTSKVIDALQANIDSADKNLQTICKVKLKRYNGKLKMD